MFLLALNFKILNSFFNILRNNNFYSHTKSYDSRSSCENKKVNVFIKLRIILQASKVIQIFYDWIKTSIKKSSKISTEKELRGTIFLVLRGLETHK